MAYDLPDCETRGLIPPAPLKGGGVPCPEVSCPVSKEIAV